MENPLFTVQKQKSLAGLSDVIIDEPIINIISSLNALHCCFTLQCCYGHFLYIGQQNKHSLDPLPRTNTISRVEYRIAYIAFCIENSETGRSLFDTLSNVTIINPDNIQFCSAEWFWERQVNSYALQVEPDRFKHQDKAFLDYKEALQVEQVRNAFFAHLRGLL